MIRICQFLHLFICRHPFTIHITPNIPTIRTIHICIKAYLFQTIIGSDLYTTQNLIPCLFLVLYNRSKIPTKFPGNFFFQIFRCVSDTNQRNTCTNLNNRCLFSIKFYIQTSIFQVFAFNMVPIQHLIFHPSSYIFNRGIKFYDKIYNIFLISISTPDIRSRR